MDWDHTLEQAAFRAQVRRVIAESLPQRYRRGEGDWIHDRVSDDPDARAAAQAWGDALSKRGWFAPHWPKSKSRTSKRWWPNSTPRARTCVRHRDRRRGEADPRGRPIGPLRGAVPADDLGARRPLIGCAAAYFVRDVLLASLRAHAPARCRAMTYVLESGARTAPCDWKRRYGKGRAGMRAPDNEGVRRRLIALW